MLRSTNYCGVVLAISLALWGGSDAAVADAAPQKTLAAGKASMGMNLSGPADWNTELPLVDVFRLSRRWISQKKGQPWGKGPELQLDRHGWVKRLEPDCWAETLMCTIQGGHYPAGQYTVLYEGRGKLDFWGGARIAEQQPGRIRIAVDPRKEAIFLRLLETDEKDYVRNIRVIMPGFEDSYEKEPFHPVFLKRWQGIACLRFMDWMHTNGSKISRWSDRPTFQDATFSEKGMPLELMIDLCNRLKCDAWFCMPHLADDDYVRQFARLTKEKLHPAAKIYIEYSNEVWNNIFAQTRYAREKAQQLGIPPAERPWEGGGKYYAQRSVEIFKIWEDVFGSRDRLVRVLAWQAGATWWTDNIVLPYNDAYKQADALAIAPYISMNLSPNSKLSSDEVAGWSVERVLDYAENKALPESIGWIQGQKKIADKYGLRLIAYEAGQHMVGVGGGENNEKLTALLHAANAHPRMGEIYRKYYDAWTAAGGQLLCYFASTSAWSKWGSWGILQYYDDDPAQSPKFMATMRWARQCGQPVWLPDSTR